MKRKFLLFTALVVITGVFINTTYGAFGTETYTKTIVKIACSAGGGGGLSGEVTPGGGSGSINGSGKIVYAHYAGRVKSCPGWAWGCWDYGAVPEITNTTPVIGCPDRK